MDCSKTLNFIMTQKRLCGSRFNCEQLNKSDKSDKSDICPLYDFCDCSPADYSVAIVKEAIGTMQKWVDDHPGKTYAQDFFEKFSEAKPDEEGVPRMCRANCYGGSCQHSDVSGASPAPCKACWNEEMEAADDE